jgi:TPR repeat protein
MHVDEAIEACSSAVQAFPGQIRYLYQYARALQIKDKQKAKPHLMKLVRANYPAAHDNLGWIYLAERNIGRAVAIFRKGLSLGDPDSMVSLVEMYDRGYAAPRTDAETKLSLFGRAASFGHPGAQRGLEAERERRDRLAEKERREAEAAKMMLNIMGGVIGNMGRR